MTRTPSGVVLPELHPGQLRLANGLKRFNVVRCGRRWGKTTFGCDYLLTDKGGRKGALSEPGPYAWFSPTNSDLAIAWEPMKELVSSVTVKTNEVNHRLWLRNGSRLDFWSLEAKLPGRGRKYRKFVVDEAAHADKLGKIYPLVIRPTLTDYRGGGLFISTPSGNNYFKELDERSGKDQFERSWASFHAPTSENPHMSPEEIDEARQDMTSLEFAQEYLAQYVSWGAGLVHPDWCHSGRTTESCPIVLGVDLAISQSDAADYTAIVAMQRDWKGDIFIRYARRFRETFAGILREVTFVSKLLGASLIVVEEVQFQAAVTQELVRTAMLPAIGWNPGRKDKLTRFLPLAAAYEHRRVFHDPELPPDFQEQITGFTGVTRNEDDDYVDAATCAYQGITQLAGRISAGTPPESNSTDAYAGYERFAGMLS